jgi:hypothetical protein
VRTWASEPVRNFARCHLRRSRQALNCVIRGVFLIPVPPLASADPRGRDGVRRASRDGFAPGDIDPTDSAGSKRLSSADAARYVSHKKFSITPRERCVGRSPSVQSRRLHCSQATERVDAGVTRTLIESVAGSFVSAGAIR